MQLPKQQYFKYKNKSFMQNIWLVSEKNCNFVKNFQLGKYFPNY